MKTKLLSTKHLSPSPPPYDISQFQPLYTQRSVFLPYGVDLMMNCCKLLERIRYSKAILHWNAKLNTYKK